MAVYGGGYRQVAEVARHDLPQKWGGACHHRMSPGHPKRGSWPMHRELSTRGDRAPGPEPPGPERRVPKARTQARRVALRRWPRRKATPNRRPGTVGRLGSHLPRVMATLWRRARRCPDSKKKTSHGRWVGVCEDVHFRYLCILLQTEICTRQSAPSVLSILPSKGSQHHSQERPCTFQNIGPGTHNRD